MSVKIAVLSVALAAMAVANPIGTAFGVPPEPSPEQLAAHRLRRQVDSTSTSSTSSTSTSSSTSTPMPDDVIRTVDGTDRETTSNSGSSVGGDAGETQMVVIVAILMAFATICLVIYGVHKHYESKNTLRTAISFSKGSESMCDSAIPLAVWKNRNAKNVASTHDDATSIVTGEGLSESASMIGGERRVSPPAIAPVMDDVNADAISEAFSALGPSNEVAV